MTDNEIFANEILCIRRRSSGSCNGGTDCNSCDLIMEDSDIISAYERAMKNNDLINRQKAEIDILIRKKESLRDEIAEQQAEIERLKGENKQIRNDCRWCEDWQTKELLGERTKAIKEFWEKVRVTIDDSRYKVINHTNYAKTCNNIIDYCIVTGDNLVEEMVGDNNV